MTHQHFKAPWGRTLLIASAFTTLLMLGTAGMILINQKTLWFTNLPVPGEAPGLVTTMVLLIPLGALPFIVRGYVVTKDGILIKRLWWNTVLRFENIRSVEVEPLALCHSVRTCGNGGLYSFTGYYWSKQLGHFRAYVTDLNRTVIVHMKDRTAVLSPDDPEGFARSVTRLLHA
ncbi:PH domain-containing protein [Prosthecobacter sp.]|uniref:PH domain-containing protein n=1 Tax=Prosthecobacter sp. TaxID=1965333 RepID=UPI003784F371